MLYPDDILAAAKAAAVRQSGPKAVSGNKVVIRDQVPNAINPASSSNNKSSNSKSASSNSKSDKQNGRSPHPGSPAGSSTNGSDHSAGAGPRDKVSAKVNSNKSTSSKPGAADQGSSSSSGSNSGSVGVGPPAAKRPKVREDFTNVSLETFPSFVLSAATVN